LVCRQCFIGRPPIKTTNQFKKIYSCCQNQQCETWLKVLSLLSESGVDYKKNCHDGYGWYIELDFPSAWPMKKRLEIHRRINDFCVCKHGARKVQCSKSGRLRSRIPGSRG
jgi:hypothetical protein